MPRAIALGCDAFQLFTRNPNRWAAPPLDPVQVRLFRRARERAAIGPAVSHATYLINLGTANPVLFAHSVAALVDELQRAAQLGLDGVVMHPGAAGGDDDEARALERVANGVRAALAATRGSRVRLLLEHTAGQGRSLGCTFEHLAAVIDRLGWSARVGVCLDTCHLLAAGYDIASPRGYAATFAAFERLVGFDRLQVVHANDSRKPCGARVDRHEHIGRGHVGLEAFARLVNDRRFAGRPLLLETAKIPLRRPTSLEPDPLDAMNLATLRGLVRVRDRQRPGS